MRWRTTSSVSVRPSSTRHVPRESLLSSPPPPLHTWPRPLHMWLRPLLLPGVTSAARRRLRAEKKKLDTRRVNPRRNVCRLVRPVVLFCLYLCMFVSVNCVPFDCFLFPLLSFLLAHAMCTCSWTSHARVPCGEKVRSACSTRTTRPHACLTTA